jgi:circadian clock protein KaiC
LVKKRSGAHEDTIREYRLTSKGLQVGPPLTEFRGIFTGTPAYGGGPKPLIEIGDSDARGDG